MRLWEDRYDTSQNSPNFISPQNFIDHIFDQDPDIKTELLELFDYTSRYGESTVLDVERREVVKAIIKSSIDEISIQSSSDIKRFNNIKSEARMNICILILTLRPDLASRHRFRSPRIKPYGERTIEAFEVFRSVKRLIHDTEELFPLIARDGMTDLPSSRILLYKRLKDTQPNMYMSVERFEIICNLIENPHYLAALKLAFESETLPALSQLVGEGMYQATNLRQVLMSCVLNPERKGNNSRTGFELSIQILMISGQQSIDLRNNLRTKRQANTILDSDGLIHTPTPVLINTALIVIYDSVANNLSNPIHRVIGLHRPSSLVNTNQLIGRLVPAIIKSIINVFSLATDEMEQAYTNLRLSILKDQNNNRESSEALSSDISRLKNLTCAILLNRYRIGVGIDEQIDPRIGYNPALTSRQIFDQIVTELSSKRK